MLSRFIVRSAILATISGLALSLAQSQTPAPQTYSYTQDPAFPIAGPAVVKITRDGPHVVVDQVMPAGFGGREKEYRGHLVYDLQAQKLYTQVLSDPGSPCGLQTFTDPAVPSLFDPVGGSADLLKEIAGGTPLKQTGTETMNGIPSNVMSLTSPKGNGKVWLAQNGGFIVRIDTIPPDGKPVTMIEIKQLSFAKPPASAFTPPGGCIAMDGDTPPKPSTNITALTLQPIAKYNGPCPANIKLTGTITVDGPGKVFYQFGAGQMAPGQLITFDAAGTKTVSQVMPMKPEYGNQMGGSAILEAIAADADGKHGTPTQGSNNSDFTVTCTSGGGK